MFVALFIIKIKLQEEFPSGASRLVKKRINGNEKSSYYKIQRSTPTGQDQPIALLGTWKKINVVEYELDAVIKTVIPTR